MFAKMREVVFTKSLNRVARETRVSGVRIFETFECCLWFLEACWGSTWGLDIEQTRYQWKFHKINFPTKSSLHKS